MSMWSRRSPDEIPERGGEVRHESGKSQAGAISGIY